jgi:(R,R)-butanediol dehydrogenase/meso-butanediol dehydrogenase/diacetyl reductase
MGATPHVVEIDDRRRARAEALGLATLAPGDDLVRRVRRSIGDGGADIVVESTGVASVAPMAVECARRGGRVVLVGLSKDTSPIDTRRLTLFERSLVGSLGYRHDLPRVLKLVAAGALDPAQLIGETIGLEDAATALETMASAAPESIKVVVDARA